MKLESLKDRKPTANDIGKTLYHIHQGEVTETVIINTNLFTLNHDYNNHFYWQKPVVISEQEYQSLQQENEELRKEAKHYENVAQKYTNEVNKLRELLELAEPIVTEYYRIVTDMEPMSDNKFTMMAIKFRKLYAEVKG